MPTPILEGKKDATFPKLIKTCTFFGLVEHLIKGAQLE